MTRQMKVRLRWIDLGCEGMRYLRWKVLHLPPQTGELRSYGYFAAPRLTETVIQLLNTTEAMAHDAEFARGSPNPG